MLVTSPFGALPDGSAVTAFTLGTHPNGARLTVLDLGATVARLQVPSGDGGVVDVTLGLAAASDYAAPTNPFLGSTVGRYANRIAGARFTLDGTEHRLVANEGDTCLHGGPGGSTPGSGWWWRPRPTPRARAREPDGDQGFPASCTRWSATRVRRHGHHRAPGRDRHPHRRKPDQPHLLQPRRPRHGRRPPPRGGGQRVPPGRCPVDSHGLPRTGAGQPVRLP